jgi:ATPase subunit of ABC transporter with duplicated ATPase domains
VGEEDGYTADSDAGELLMGLGIPVSEHERPMREVAGGFKLRVLLAQALFGKPDALLLDEPTNNLDLDTIRWLERFLTKYSGVLITISHDRHFLNAVCTHIADIDYETHHRLPGQLRRDGDDEEPGARLASSRRTPSARRRSSQLQDFVARFSAGTRASQVQSRKRRSRSSR